MRNGGRLLGSRSSLLCHSRGSGNDGNRAGMTATERSQNPNAIALEQFSGHSSSPCGLSPPRRRPTSMAANMPPAHMAKPPARMRPLNGPPTRSENNCSPANQSPPPISHRAPTSCARGCRCLLQIFVGAPDAPALSRSFLRGGGAADYAPRMRRVKSCANTVMNRNRDRVEPMQGSAGAMPSHRSAKQGVDLD